MKLILYQATIAITEIDFVQALFAARSSWGTSLRQSVVWKKESDQFQSCLARVKCVFRVILLDADWPAVKMLAAAAGPVRGWSGQRPVRVLVGKLCRKHHQKQSP